MTLLLLADLLPMQSSPHAKSQQEASLPITVEQQGGSQHKEKLIFPPPHWQQEDELSTTAPLTGKSLPKYTLHHYRNHLSWMCRSLSRGLGPWQCHDANSPWEPSTPCLPLGSPAPVHPAQTGSASTNHCPSTLCSPCIWHS